MPTIQFQLAITFDDEGARALAEFLAPAIKQAIGLTANEVDDRKQVRLRSSQNAIFVGQKPPEDQGWLIDSKEVAKLLNVSGRTVFAMHKAGTMPPPIRIGRAVRWNADALRKWIDAGCPASSSSPRGAGFPAGPQ